MKAFFLVVVVVLTSTLVESEEVKEVNNPKILHDAVEMNNSMIQSRIIGGTFTDVYFFPYQVRLSMTFLLPIFDLRQCGGSIITENWVLTAAHCLDAQEILGIGLIPVTSVTVEAGSKGQTSPNQFSQSMTVLPTNFHIHPNYVSSSRIQDFALLRTDPWDFVDTYVHNIELPPPSLNIYQYSGLFAIASGYGSTSSDDPNASSPTLQYIGLEMLSAEDCLSQWGSDLPSTAFCAQDQRPAPKGSVCTSDLGGPLAMPGSSITILIGVASVIHPTRGCDGTSQGFQMVGQAMQWITSTISPTA